MSYNYIVIYGIISSREFASSGDLSKCILPYVLITTISLLNISLLWLIIILHPLILINCQKSIILTKYIYIYKYINYKQHMKTQFFLRTFNKQILECV